ncbi:peptidyl-prolyl cis-trans isomerase SurA [Rubripirellula lacrimiformis]|uniref:peptidylprolyl isomerase n=1 Tax=Rubripirellula lacrimiformis TaxID=1930273 RepID=A0A517N806_9BACT|nr:peptidylprolyl isomerase [Rubripirellula lacrimiformis]QDT03261.1 peptidyl-prolyl cis-trans isomerase SurA [Rubripirellula lacrimiformis]
MNPNQNLPRWLRRTALASMVSAVPWGTATLAMTTLAVPRIAIGQTILGQDESRNSGQGQGQGPATGAATANSNSQTGQRRSAKLEPSDPFAAIDGQPIYVGEINLVLTQRIDVRDLERVGLQVQRATALLLVRRHLAMKALQGQGGETLAAGIRRRVQAYQSEASRMGTSMEELAAKRQSTADAMVADLAWTSAWTQYLKSRMTTANLRKFFDRNQAKYGGGRFDVSQVFVPVDASDPASVAATADRMTQWIEDIRAAAGPDADSLPTVFASEASQHSQAGSAEDGGHLGWVAKDGDLPAEVMAAIRSATASQMIGPIQSKLGMHVVLVHQAEAGTGTFDELTDQSALRRDAANALFDALVASQKDAKVVWFGTQLQGEQVR